MKIQSITSKECRNGKMMHTVQFSDGDYAEQAVGFFGEFPFKIGDNISANIKPSKDGRYLNGYDPKLVKVAAPDPLEGAVVNGVKSDTTKIVKYPPTEDKLFRDGILNQLQSINELLSKIERLLTPKEVSK